MKLYAILPITLCMLLTGVNTNNTRFETVETTSTNTTYLVLTENGLYNNEKGENNETLFLENVIEFKGSVGDDLPGKDVVTSIVPGIYFSSWVRYEGGGIPSKHTKVPSDNGAILYADWTTNPSGGSGGDISMEMDVYFKAPEAWGDKVNIYLWDDYDVSLKGWPGTEMEVVSDGVYKFRYDTAVYTNVIFNDGTNQTDDLKSPYDKDMACYVYGKGWLATDTEELPSEPVIAESGWYIVGEGSFVNGSTWSVDGGIKMGINDNYTGKGVEYYATDVQFSSGDTWKLCSTENEWISNGWETESGALSSGDMELVDDGFSGHNVSVVTTGSYDIYYKVYGDGTYSCWISEAK